MPSPACNSSSTSPTPSSTDLKSSQVTNTTGVQRTPGLPTSPSNVALFITNLRLLDLDLRRDWPSIDKQTFSTHDAQQNQRKRIRCVEWSLFRLFELWDAEEARNKLQPFFPPLEPLQSRNLRTALFRCLSELKKNGILGRETILRKTMLDECKGEKLEEILLAFSIAVLKKVVRAKPQYGSTCTISKQLATAGTLSRTESESMIPLAIAHKASLTALLRRKRDLRARYDDFRELLHSKRSDALRDEEHFGKYGAKSLPKNSLSKEACLSLRQEFRENWLGDPDWVDTIFDGDQHREDLLLTTPFEKVKNCVIEGRLSDLEINKQKGLLEVLQNRADEQLHRLAKWKAFREGLLKDRPERATYRKSDAIINQEHSESFVSFTAHRDLIPQLRNSFKGPESVSGRDFPPAISINPGHSRLITNMKADLAEVDKSKSKGGRRWRGDGLGAHHSGYKTGIFSTPSSQSHTRHDVKKACESDEETPNLSSSGDVKLSSLDLQSRQSGIPDHARLFSAERRSSGEPRIEAEDELEEETGEGEDYPITKNRDMTSPTKNTTMSNIHPIPPLEIPSRSGRSMPPPTTELSELDQLAADIINRVTDSQPSPIKTRPSLIQRTRMSMAFSSSEDFNQSLPEETPLPVERKPKKPSNASIVVSDPQATLLERTRQSMSLLPAAPHRLQKAINKPRKSLYPTNQFEMPQKQQLSESATQKTAPIQEDLFGQEADYASIFKSRPKIALSPTFSPVSDLDLPALNGLMDAVDEDENHQDGQADYHWGSSPLIRAKAKVGR